MPPSLAHSFGAFAYNKNEDSAKFEEVGWRCVYLTSLIPPNLRVLATPPVLTEEVTEHLQEIRAEAKQSKQRLVEGTLRYVINIACSYIGKGVPYLDLVQEGVFGLMRAAEGYDEQHGAHFQLYAAQWIRQRIARCIADSSRVIRVPVHLGEEIGKIEKIYARHLEQSGKLPSDYEIYAEVEWLTRDEIAWWQKKVSATQLQVRLKKYHELLRYRTNADETAPWYILPSTLKALNETYERLSIQKGGELSPTELFLAMRWLSEQDIDLLNMDFESQAAEKRASQIGAKLHKAERLMQRYRIANANHYSLESTQFTLEDEFLLIEDVLPAAETVEEAANKAMLASTINSVMNCLSDRERQIIELRFGLKDGTERTLEEIGQMLGLTRERIRQIEAKALTKLRHPVRSRQLRAYLSDAETEIVSREEVDANFYSIELQHKLDFIDSTNDGVELEIYQEQKRTDRMIRRYITKARERLWDTKKHGSIESLLREVLEEFGQPTRYSQIHARAMERVADGFQFSKQRTYSTLFYRSDIFRPFGNAVFGLASWTAHTTNSGGETVFHHCPVPLLPSTGYTNAFFESVMVGRDLLKKKNLSAREFWSEMRAWAKRNEGSSGQDAQNALDAWYAAGLFDRVEFNSDGKSPLKMTIGADAKLSEVRQHCLHNLCRRILKMPELLLTLDRVARPTVSVIQKVLFGGERAGFDVPLRLAILAAFGAVQADGEEWQLTDLGRGLLKDHPPQELPDFGEIEAFKEKDELKSELEWEDELALLDI
ncbi:MAG: sigma-70 family RNA polymerase sigma factor [Chloroflexi bacterium]|nr:sigma-70 family RNA polymerase sigma factor [Chloroflexota bacterium]